MREESQSRKKRKTVMSNVLSLPVTSLLISSQLDLPDLISSWVSDAAVLSPPSDSGKLITGAGDSMGRVEVLAPCFSKEGTKKLLDVLAFFASNFWLFTFRLRQGTFRGLLAQGSFTSVVLQFSHHKQEGEVISVKKTTLSVPEDSS